MLVGPAEYAARFGLPECSIYGILTNDLPEDCRDVLDYRQRRLLLNALETAQQMLERELGYNLEPRWESWQIKPIGTRLFLPKGHLIQLGQRQLTLVDEYDLPFGYAEDPLDIEVPYTGKNLVVMAGSYEIRPVSVRIDSDIATITLSWCSLAKRDATLNVARYSDVTQWAYQTVQVYTEETVGLGIVDSTGTALTGTIVSERLGIIELGYEVDSATVYCQTGARVPPPMAVEAVIRLAHSLLPEPPCGCDWVESSWRRDREVPTMIPEPLLLSPFGLSNGALFAWQFARAHGIIVGGVAA